MNNRFRTLTTLVLVCLLLLGSVGYVRIADVHFGPEKTIGENPTPQERVAFGLADLTRTNYRMEATQVSTNRTSGEVWYQANTVQRVNHNSEQIYITKHTKRFDDESSLYQYTAKKQAWRVVVPDTERRIAPRRNVDWDRSGDRYSPSEHRIPLNGSAEWHVINKTDQTVVVGIDSAEEYRHAFEISRRFRTASNGSISVHLDRETGTIQKVVVTEAATVELSSKDKRVPSRMKLVYEYDRSGDISITPPKPARGFSFEAFVEDLIRY